ncbi:unnamed protein product [Durusdinium trenchii]|uniref:Uncharacterized protein n=1 Tax=Durusdinium trenchii TaxID=1381693 RepID=A0ABP0JHU0_9DINO
MEGAEMQIVEAQIDLDLAMPDDVDNGAAADAETGRGRSKSRSPKNKRGRAKTPKGKAKAKSKGGKSGRAAAEGETMQCPLPEFEASCPAPGNNLPRCNFDFVQFMQREKVALIASHSEEREPMSKKQWLAYAQEVKNHDMSEAEALAEWKRMVDDVDGFERASKGRNGEVRIYCPTREVKTSTRAREESYEVTKQAKARKFNESGLEELREDLRQRSGFSSVSGEEWRQYGGGKAAASNSALVNAAGLTQAGGVRSQANIKTLEEVVEGFAGDMDSIPPTPTPSQSVLGEEKPENPEQPPEIPKKGKNFDAGIWRMLEGLLGGGWLVTRWVMVDSQREVLTMKNQEEKAKAANTVLLGWLQSSMVDWQLLLGRPEGLLVSEEISTLGDLLPCNELKTVSDSKLNAVLEFEQSKACSAWFRDQVKTLRLLKALVNQTATKITTTIKTYQKAHKSAHDKKVAQAKKNAKKGKEKEGEAGSVSQPGEVASSGSSGVSVSSPLLTQEFLKSCQAIKVHALVEAFHKELGPEASCWAVPFVIKGLQAPVRERFENSNLRPAAEYFEQVVTEKASSLVRARCTPDHCQEVQQLLLGLLPKDRMVDLANAGLEDEKVLKAVVSTRLVAQGAQKPYAGFEYEDLGSWEVPVKGQKQVVLFQPGADMPFFMSNDGSKLLDAESKVLAKHAHVHTLTIAEGLYWPPGWACVSVSVGKSPCFSLSQSFLLRHLVTDGEDNVLNTALTSSSSGRQAWLDAWKKAQAALPSLPSPVKAAEEAAKETAEKMES